VETADIEGSASSRSARLRNSTIFICPNLVSEGLSKPDRLGAGSKSRVAHHQFAVVKRWANQDRAEIIFADSGQLASQKAGL
jgi:hypothetical protein